MSKHVMAVATYYQLYRGADGFDLDSKKVINKGVLVPRKHIEKINGQYKGCGKYYEIDEDATDAAFEQGAKKVAIIKEAEANKAELGNILAESIKELKKPKVKVDDTPEINEELDAARDEYEELFGERPHHATKLATINAKIEAELNN